MDRRQHRAQSQDARLRRGRHQGHAGSRRPHRQVRGPERALRGSGAFCRLAGSRRLRPAGRQKRVRLPQPGRRFAQRDPRPALPRRSLACRLRLGAGRSCRRAQGGAGRKTQADDAGRSAGAGGAPKILAYNRAHDVVLPGSKGPKVGFLMYPQAETGAGRLDSLDPDSFKYTITAREVAPA